CWCANRIAWGSTWGVHVVRLLRTGSTSRRKALPAYTPYKPSDGLAIVHEFLCCLRCVYIAASSRMVTGYGATVLSTHSILSILHLEPRPPGLFSFPLAFALRCDGRNARWRANRCFYAAAKLRQLP